MFRIKKAYHKIPDNDLADLYKKDKSTAIIREIYVRFGHLMFGTCLKYLKNKEEAEDCVMEIFEALPEKLVKYEIMFLKSWLFMITKNACLMKIRKAKLETIEIRQELIHESDNPENLNLKESQLILMEEIFNDLNVIQQQTLRLFYYEKKSYHEISLITNLTVKKVKSAIQNGKRNLKLKLEDNDCFKNIF